MEHNQPDGLVITDSDECSIYIDYGHGFMWDGYASKSKLYITSPLSYDDNADIIERDEIDLWVYEYFISHGWSTNYIKSRIVVDQD